MAEVHPFRGWRYDLAQVGSLADVTAPPYDVIGPADQKELYERHPCNVVRLILNRDEPGDETSDERYNRAAQFLRHWQSEGILILEREETFFVYHQEFQWEGVEYLRKGFLGRLKLEEFGKGTVFPHEQTMSGPKADRLKLTQACRMNLSPIFGLYPDDEESVQTPLEKAIVGQTALEVTDDLGVVHRIWTVTDTAVLNRVREHLADKQIFIADGHHRYETAVNYRNGLQSQGKLKNEAAAANFVMMMFVGMNDPGLAILPTHRLISGLPDLTADEIREALSPHFQLDEVGAGAEAAKETWEMMEADGGQNVFGFGTAADGKWLFARLADESLMAELAAEHSDAWRQLGVSLLHTLVLDHLLIRNNPESEQVCRYVHLLDEVTACLSERSCQLACLIAPARIEDVQVIASKFEKMPPKSTFFYPKLLSGLVFNPLA
jgi:uncharacterized protein (DUF1015 family)